MNLEHIRTFLEVADCGNFNRAAENLNVTQSTVSARIKTLEDHFGLQLFKRARKGVELSGAGRRFHGAAVNVQHFWQRAHQTVTLPEGYRDVLALAAQVSLWERLILPWIPWMRDQDNSVALRVDADYSSSQMRHLADGLLDIGVMYQPRRMEGLIIEELFQETLVLVSTRPRKATKSWDRGLCLSSIGATSFTKCTPRPFRIWKRRRSPSGWATSGCAMSWRTAAPGTSRFGWSGR